MTPGAAISLGFGVRGLGFEGREVGVAYTAFRVFCQGFEERGRGREMKMRRGLKEIRVGAERKTLIPPWTAGPAHPALWSESESLCLGLKA